MPNPRLPVKVNYDPAMSFVEIGRRLGISRKLAFVVYARALKKIAARPQSLEALRELVEFRRSLRGSDPWEELRREDSGMSRKMRGREAAERWASLEHSPGEQ